MKNVPNDVLEAMVYLFNNQPVGQELYHKIENTIIKYPEYFPWETKYNSIDSSVHGLYDKEKSDIYYRFYPRKEFKKGKGMIAYINRQQELSESLPKRPLEKILKEIIEKEENYKKVEKTLWNKHYKKHKLKDNK